MRVRSWAVLVAAALVLVLTGGQPSFAENEDALRYGNHRFPFRQPEGGASRARPTRAPGYYAAPPQYYSPGRAISPERRYQRRYYYDDPREVRTPSSPFDPRIVRRQGDVEIEMPNQVAPRLARRPDDPQRSRKVIRRAVPAVPSVARARPADEKPREEEVEVEASTTIVTFGDSLAEMVGQGLDEAYEEALDVEVVRKTRGDSGLVRQDHYDWAKTVQEFVASGQKITFAVLMLGSNDRQSLREGETSHDPLSERWRTVYRERVDAMLKPLAEKKIPFIWVGVPPMRNDRLSADLVAMNDIYRERAQKAGGVYVDVWQGFVDDQNRYAQSGPDLEGQVTRLRTPDGVHFTRAGARKAAHYAESELKRFIEQRNANGGSGVATVPAAPSLTAPTVTTTGRNVEEIIAASLPALPEPPGLPSLAARPVAGPVLPLTRPDVSPGGALVSARPRFDGDAAYIVDRTLRQGVAPVPKTGRADDFKWPRS